MGDMRTRHPANIAEPTSERSAFAFRQESDDQSIPGFLRQLTEQAGHLADEQANLPKAEVRSSVDDIKIAAGAMAGAAVVGIAGLGVLLMGLSFLLAQVMPVWAATLIVAVATLALAYAMFTSGRAKLQSGSLDMSHSRRTIERAPSAISGNAKQEHHHGR